MSPEDEPAPPLWPWIVIPLLLIAAAAAALWFTSSADSGGLSDASGYRVR